MNSVCIDNSSEIYLLFTIAIAFFIFYITIKFDEFHSLIFIHSREIRFENDINFCCCFVSRRKWKIHKVNVKQLLLEEEKKTACRIQFGDISMENIFNSVSTRYFSPI